MNAPLPDIALIGLAQAGKDTVARLIMEEDPSFQRVAFADPVREMALRLDPLVDDREVPDHYSPPMPWRLSDLVEAVGWEEAKKAPDVRRLLQRMGTEAIRTVAPDFWVDLAMKAADAHEGRTVFTDARFANEVHAILRRPGVVVRVVRPGAESAIGSATAHASEALARDWAADYTLTNDGTLDDLRREVRHMLAEVDLYLTRRPF